MKKLFNSGRFWVALTWVILMLGCSKVVYDDRFSLDKVERTSFQLDITYEQQPVNQGTKVNGYAYWTEDTCKIVLKKGYGNSCLLHEVFHCVYGQWHEGRNNGEFCL